MAELDKKMQKNSTDLVQSVLEAMERRNVERVDMLVTNAFKQLKMSRFKPDQATCNSLTYLARVCPKAFSQSANLKELLKTHIKRDSGPTNIKGTKNDFILPVLAANILLACCDSTDVRSIILTRIEQWIGSNQKLNELVQHLLAILCVRCHDDPHTVKTLIDMRSHWYQFLDINYETYGSVSKDLSRSIRNLIAKETSCELLIENLCFLSKHDPDIVGLSTSISKLIVQRPISVETMLDHFELGDQLKQMLSSIYDKLFDQLSSAIKKDEHESAVFIKLSNPEESVIAVDRSTIEALLILVSSPKMGRHLEAPGPAVRWVCDQRSLSVHSLAYNDRELNQPMEVPTKLLQRLILSGNLLVDLAIKCARPIQVLELIQSFGIGKEIMQKLFLKLDDVDADDMVRSGIKDLPFFNELVEYHQENGIKGTRKLIELDNSLQDIKVVEQKPEVLVKVKEEPV